MLIKLANVDCSLSIGDVTVKPSTVVRDWPPIEARIRHKLCLLMHMVHTGRCPPYLKDVLLPVSSSSGRSGLQSATTA